MTKPQKNAVIMAARDADWMQVAMVNMHESGEAGKPCFHVERGRFCLRGQAWDGHRSLRLGDGPIHKFVSLEQLVRNLIERQP